MIASPISAFIAAVTFAVSLHAVAQPGGQPVRSVGLLVPSRLEVLPDYPTFVEALRALGYREGVILHLVAREADNKLERLPILARELVNFPVEAIVAFNTPGARAAIDATRQVPIVMTQVGDPLGSGFVASLARPGGNVTGVSNMIADLAAKRLALLKEAIPSGKRIAVIFNSGDPITAPQVRDVESSASKLAVEVRFFRCETSRTFLKRSRKCLGGRRMRPCGLLGSSMCFRQ